ncbi:MAG: hypothetical protein M3256_28140 [Actinomycetota bacterium]|nr:hypothetical protein [Actinomycetota bacterium]
MARHRVAEVRFYVDADTLGLAHILAGLRADVTYPGDPGQTIKRRQRPACPIVDTDVDDDVWIPEVARRGWLILTRDKAIDRRPGEKQAVLRHAAKLVTIASNEVLDNWRMLEIVMSQWRQIEGLTDLPGPFIYTVTRTGLAPIDLAAGSKRRSGGTKGPHHARPSQPDEGKLPFDGRPQ